MKVTPGHLLGQMGMRDVVETDERLIIELSFAVLDLTNVPYHAKIWRNVERYGAFAGTGSSLDS